MTERNPIPPWPIALPRQVEATENFTPVDDARLWYWDTGGTGTPVVLLHPGTGSALSWPYQQPVLAEAGHRVIAYSRRGHANSTPGDPAVPGTMAGDLHAVVEHLGLERVHLVGVAHGGIGATDYALTHPDRVASLVLACTIVGVQDEDYLRLSSALRPDPFHAMPAEFRELGPSYRAADPAGVRRWVDLQRVAAPARVTQPTASPITWSSLSTLTVPTLFIGGDADLWSPPSVQRLLAAGVPNAKAVIVEECGHSVHWERPEEFNGKVVGFIDGR